MIFKLKLHGVFIEWGMNNSDDYDVFEFIGAFEEFDLAEALATDISKQLSEDHSYSHAKVIEFETNKNYDGAFKN